MHLFRSTLTMIMATTTSMTMWKMTSCLRLAGRHCGPSCRRASFSASSSLNSCTVISPSRRAAIDNNSWNVRADYCRPSFGSSKNNYYHEQKCSFSQTALFFSDTNSDGTDNGDVPLEKTEYNIPSLKKEVTRLTLRTHKKIGKASTRLRGAQDQLDQLRKEIEESDSNTNATDCDEEEEALMKKLENAPTTQQIQQYESDIKELQSRLKQLNYLEEQFSSPLLSKKKILSKQDMEKLLVSNNKQADFEEIVRIVEELEISDDEGEKKKRVEMDLKNKKSKKEKAVNNRNNCGGEAGPRLPYRKYYSEKDLEIRVGKQATDNDTLSLSPQHRDPSHWWFHASGCPGSHVVLCTDASYDSTIAQDVMDAAALAAWKSKCYSGGQSVIKVSMTRCRNVSKPPGAKAGLVQLNGEVKTVTLKRGDVEMRCQRLEETVVVN